VQERPDVPWLLLTIAVLAALPFYGSAVLWILKPRSTHWPARWARGFALQALAALPALALQMIREVDWSGAAWWKPAPVAVLVLPIHVGGWTVRILFEAFRPHRRDFLLSDAHWYVLVLAVQVLIVAAVIAVRSKRRPLRSDLLVWAVLFLLAALAVVGERAGAEKRAAAACRGPFLNRLCRTGRQKAQKDESHRRRRLIRPASPSRASAPGAGVITNAMSSDS
jgi:hypothetical protein